MLKDITIGQHFPGHSILHRCDPRLKLVATIAYIVVLFVAPNPLGLALSILLLAALYKVAQIPGKMILKSLKPIVPIVIFTAVLNLFFVTGQGEPLVHFWVLNIYVEGVKYAILLAVRVCALIAGTSLLTYTTSPIVLTDAIESLLRPLAKLHFPVHELAMMMTIALRFIPTLIEETEKIMNAQKARGAMLDSGTFTQRIKALVPILIPLFISAFRRADELAMAMECRCYHGGEGRTKMNLLRYGRNDFFAYGLGVLLLAAVIVLLVAMSSVSGAKRKKRMAQAIDTIELSPDVRDSFGKRRRRAQNAGSAKPEKGAKKPEENRTEAQIVPTPEFKPDEQPSSTPARDALRRAEGEENRRRRAQQEVPTDKTLRVAPVEERPEFTPQGKVDDSKTRIFGRLDVEGALKEEQAKAEAPKANEEKTEAAQETIRLSGEDVQKLKTQAREDHFGVKGKKREEIKPMKKKKGLFGLGKKKDEDDDFLIDANDDDEDDDDLFE